MRQLVTVLLLHAALALALQFAAPAQADDRVTVPEQPADLQKQTPPPPAGCPFRNGKLELIA